MKDVLPSKKRIMVVDDEDRICEIYTKVLISEGFDVEAFMDGETAIESFSKNIFDIVITDLKMPKKDGYYVIQKIREMAPKTDIIVITGYATMDSVIKTIKLGAYDYLVKPFEIDDLVNKVKKCITERSIKSS
jgi:two-component system, NtrC family, response regulator PilR